MGDREPTELASEILRASRDMAYAIDVEGRLLWWNDTLAKTVGYDDAELAGMDVFELIPADQRADARAAFRHVETVPDDVTLTFEVVTADGDHVTHEFNGGRIEVDGEPVIAGIGRDVSEHLATQRELRAQRDELDRLNRISETVYEVIQAVTDAATREGNEEVTCERLAECDLYRAVWIGRNDGPGPVDPSAAAGHDKSFVEAVAAINDLEWTRPARRALDGGEPLVVRRGPDASLPDRVAEAAERFGIEAGIAVPLVHRERVEGVLCVYSARADAFEDRERDALRRLGYVVGFAIHAVRTERLIHSGTATELRFRTTAPDGVLASLSERADGHCTREWSTPTADGRYRHYLTVEGIDPDDALAFFADRDMVESAGHVGTVDGDEVFEVVTSDSLVRRLVDVGAATTNVVAEDGVSTVVAEIPGQVETRPIVDAVEALYDTELVSKRTVDRPVRTVEEFRDPVGARLTERQETALRTAYRRGYFSWPRDATAEEVAEVMDVTSPTLHYHLRRAQQALVEAYLEYLE